MGSGHEDHVHVSTVAPWLLWIKDSAGIMSMEKLGEKRFTRDV